MQEIIDEIIESIDYIYRNGTLADLEKIKAELDQLISDLT